MKTVYINRIYYKLFFTTTITLTIIAFVVLPFSSHAQDDHRLLKKADQSYIKQDFNKAEEDYRKALELKKNQTTTYNLGNAIMEQNRPDEAINYYEEAAKKSEINNLNAKSLYNLGNAYYQKKDFEKSVNAFKQSLKLEPADMDTKKNLTLATRQLIKQQQQQQQQQQNQDKKQDQKDDQQQPNQDPQSGKPQDQKQDQQPQSGEAQPKPEGMTKEEAEQLLQYTEREDQRVQQKLTNKSKKNNPPKKDW